MQAKITLSKKGKPPKLGLVQFKNLESRKLALSKDELIDFVVRSHDKCRDLSNGLAADAIPILLFLQYAAQQDEPPENLVLRLKDGDLNYCNIGNAMAPILQWLAVKLHECHNEIDASCMEAATVVQSYKDGHRKAASSR